MMDEMIRMAWDGVELSPEADARIRKDLENALAERERRHSQRSRWRRVNRKLSKTAIAAIVAGALLTVAAIAAAAIRLPAVVSARKQESAIRVSDTVAPTGGPAGTEEPAGTLLAEATAPPEPLQAASDETDFEPSAAESPVPQKDEEPTPTPAPKPQPGWNRIDGKWYYYLGDMSTLTGWQTIESKRYLFEEDGSTYTGWLDQEGSWYFFHPFENHGAMTVGWLRYFSDGTYYFDSEGHMVTGWQTIDGKRYYFFEDGRMAGLWQDIDGYRYFFDPFNNDGGMTVGWLGLFAGSRYYFDGEGHMVTGWQTIDGKRYYFDEDGRAVGQWQDIDGYRYFFDPFNNNGAMTVGWLQLFSEGSYYFDAEGHMVTGWQTIDGKEYYFGEDGIQRITEIEDAPGGQEEDTSAPGQMEPAPQDVPEEPPADGGEADACEEIDAEAGPES